MRELISLRAFGLSEIDAVRYYVALKMAEPGLVPAPNMAVGEPFNIGLTGSAFGSMGMTNGMAPVRRCERLVKSIEDASASVRGLPLLNADRVWDRFRHIGPDELLQFDWTIVGEADGLAADLSAVAALDEVDVPAVEARLRKIREVAGDRQRYIEVS
jgi:hypothetical protein